MYKAFISYSHSADEKLAPALQTALENFAKPWYKIRQFSIFRDEVSLTASPHLWLNIQRALEQSEYFIYLASPVSASSNWVRKEIEFWLKNKSIETLLIVLTDGEIVWDENTKFSSALSSNSLPNLLISSLKEQPLYVDLRYVRTKQDLDIQNPLFKKGVLKLAAHLHGKEPKDLASEEVYAHRKLVRLRNGVIIILILLLFLSCIAAWFATENAKDAKAQKDIAIRERNRAQSNYLVSTAKSVENENPTLGIRLAEEAVLKYNDPAHVEYLLKVYNQNQFYRSIGKDYFTLSAALSHDGSKLLIGCQDSLARLYDLKGKLLNVLKGHTGMITSVAFSSDSKFVLTASRDSTVRLWDLKAGDVRQIFKSKTGSVETVRFSPKSTKILINCNVEDNGRTTGTSVLYLCDVKGNIEHRFKESVYSVDYSPDGERFLTASLDGTISILDESGKLLKTFEAHHKAIYSAKFSHDGKKIVTTSRDSTAAVWDLKGNRLVIYRGFNNIVYSGIFTHDDSFIITGDVTGLIRFWNLDGRNVLEFKGNIESLFPLDNNQLISVGAASLAQLWYLKDMPKMKFKDSGRVYSVAFSPDGKSLVTGSGNRIAHLWDLNGNTKQIFKGFINDIFSVAFSPDGNAIVTGSAWQSIRLWDLNGKSSQHFQEYASYGVDDIAFSPNGKFILSGSSSDSAARLWDLNGTELSMYRGAIKSVAFSPDGKLVLTGSEDGTASLWDLKGNKLREFKGSMNVSSAVFSPDGKTILTAGDSTCILDLAGNVLRKFMGSRLAIFSPDGQSILITDSYLPSIVRILDLKGSILREFKGFFESAECVAFSPDGKDVVIGADDGAYLFEIGLPVQQFLNANRIQTLSIAEKRKYGIE